MQQIPFHLPQQITEKTAWISTSGFKVVLWADHAGTDLAAASLVCEVTGAKEKVVTVPSITDDNII